MENILYTIMGIMWALLIANIFIFEDPVLGKIALVFIVVLYFVLDRMYPLRKNVIVKHRKY